MPETRDDFLIVLNIEDMIEDAVEAGVEVAMLQQARESFVRGVANGTPATTLHRQLKVLRD